MDKTAVKTTFLLLIPLLLLQIPLRHIYDLEPYPSILLPGGASIIKDRGFISLAQTQLVAVNAKGKRYEVSVHDLLRTMPVQYRQHVVRRTFGLPVSTNGRMALASSSVIASGRAWLRHRLANILGQDDFVTLEIIKYRIIKPTTDLTYLSEKNILGTTEIPLQ